MAVQASQTPRMAISYIKSHSECVSLGLFRWTMAVQPFQTPTISYIESYIGKCQFGTVSLDYGSTTLSDASGGNLLH